MSTLLVSTFLILGITEHGRVGRQANDHSCGLFAKDMGELRDGIETLST